jgi:hypothetical protein
VDEADRAIAPDVRHCRAARSPTLHRRPGGSHSAGEVVPAATVVGPIVGIGRAEPEHVSCNPRQGRSS